MHRPEHGKAILGSAPVQPRLGDQEPQLRKIAGLMKLRDDLRLIEIALAAGANRKGMMMHAPERKRAFIEAGDWVMAATGSPVEMWTKGLLQVLETAKQQPDVLPSIRRLADSTEELAVWVKRVQTLGKAVKCTSLGGLAILGVTSTASYALKYANKRQISIIDALEHAMDEVWSMSLAYGKQVNEVVLQLDVAISQLR